MNCKKALVLLWLFILLLGAVIFPIVEGYKDLLEVLKNPKYAVNILYFYRSAFFPDCHFWFVVPVSALAFLMAFLSLVAWWRNPGPYTLIGTIVGVWGMCGPPGRIILLLSVDVSVEPSALPLLKLRPWFPFIAPSIYILYHFLWSVLVLRERNARKDA